MSISSIAASLINFVNVICYPFNSLILYIIITD
ncbi:hypothetical protein [Campylobacter phage CJLB-14]|nr:hypothetical protein [Campylobacter phage CJLB-14]